MNRKSFIKKTSVGILVGIPAISIVGCSSGDDGNNPAPDPDPDPDPQAGDCLENGTEVSIGSNHGHSLTVSKEDVEAAAEKTYTLSEGNEHIHMVTITAAQFNSLKDNNAISATSTTNSGHSHSVSVSCA